ncbi:signal recognition particle-docking protein FtsY [Microvirga lotononidis]|uniref:Signal recognition particle receptor FtsY n=1 Tax=Microvirga lotononidis TaxID=864069 RepID=I4YZ72_9HYPH|nr:signal recognition particle-docking protein FtsY [Microvirga lotononidis]EIM29264.1 signal recognition particle-docking protein FtsY [Microvirga lotononidis]WQO29095.1 signal recognition particle-docking protein FtsY [Microvirga lotononidis]
MAETKPDKPGFFSRLFGRKAEEAPAAPAPETPQAGGEPEAMPSPPATAADDLTAAPPSVTTASPDTPEEDKVPPELAGADLQPVEGLDPEGTNPQEPLPRIVTETGPELRPDISAADLLAPEPAPAEVVPAPEQQPAASRGWWQRLTDGMRRTSSSLSESVTGLFTKRKLDDATLEELEDALVQADLGVPTAMRITEAIASGRYNKEISPQEVKAILAGEVEKALQPVAQALSIDRSRKPFVVLMVGVNGAGKTTTIGKLSQKFREQGLKVMLAAGDTFRAAAIEQLKVWGERVGAPVLARAQGADAAGLAYDALQEAKANGTDVLLIDTAGRLQNKAGLMAELEKIVRVVKKFDPTAPHATLLVLDATVGQNAVSQVELFQKAAGVTGLIMTKLDGTARGGILVALAAKFGLPVHFIGVGEGVEDLEPFTARDFAKAIAGLDTAS